jgi:hypothetical protein
MTLSGDFERWRSSLRLADRTAFIEERRSKNATERAPETLIPIVLT